MAECTIYDKLRYIAETKDLIKTAIETQDVEVLESDTFRKYAEYITEIRKVSSVNGMQGDVTITAEDIGALTTIPEEYVTNDDLSDYYTKTEIDEKGYLTAVPDNYITTDELTTELTDKVSVTALNEAIEGVENKIPSLEGYATEQWVEDKNYLTQHQDISNLATKDEVNAKQDSLVSGTNIKTINGESILGSGDIELAVEVDLSEYVTETELSNKGYLTSIPSEYITESELNTKLTDKQDVLVSGTNIKTINGNTILGNGNLTIEGGGGTINIIELTQEEYDALTEYSDNTFYVITDKEKEYVTNEELAANHYTKTEIDEMLGNASTTITEINNLVV